MTETCIDERTEVIYPALAPLPVGTMVWLEADPVRCELWVHMKSLPESERQGAAQVARAINRAFYRLPPWRSWARREGRERPAGRPTPAGWKGHGPASRGWFIKPPSR